ncbi:CLUMA_CG007296, isoform A [Clunio marinus]|uniref:CLUMA_CG007296, isoform A n=1 Tax=Clunio marinus TaxID=568069 RepID=A0A1J1I096_9DIPT|nr:CLUMA_CG007296, isoform A [Clunio marinus]
MNFKSICERIDIKLIFALIACIFVICVTIFASMELMEREEELIELTDNIEDSSETTDSTMVISKARFSFDIHPSLVIIAPVNCQRGEKLDTTSGQCKKSF